ncbi:MAG: hypothetical protein DRP11_03290 [Candidatus Aenigmatarchaeota archaeon]|nr:MAG: hypothetical protein DRP11_03290 [Candidatus Aenigmarchaeota archaeon]
MKLNSSYTTKNPKELIVPVLGLVKNVTGYTSIQDETRYFRLEIDIESDTPPVKKVLFNEPLPIEKGDEIMAYLFKGYTKSGTYGSASPVFEETELREEEPAIKIEKLRDGEVVATYINNEFRDLFG